MLPVGYRVYVDFRIVDAEGTPIAGRALSDWQVLLQRDNEPCADELTLVDKGLGRYTVSYLPSAPGHDYLEIYDQLYDIRVISAEDILPQDFAIGGAAGYLMLDHDFGGVDKLALTGVTDPASYRMFVYRTADWYGGRRSDSDALGITSLDAVGRWNASIPVPAGTYDIVAKKLREVHTVAQNLRVG